MYKVKVNISFRKILRRLQGDKINKLINKEMAYKVAKASASYILAGKVVPKLSDNNPRKGKPLFDTRALVKSLKGTPKGIRAIDYATEHRKPGGYTWKNFNVPQREFIITQLPMADVPVTSEQGTVDKIYKEFQDKFVKLISKSIRK